MDEFLKKYIRKPTARCVRHVRLHRRADSGRGAEAVRRQPDSRKRHEAGSEHQGPPRSAACRRASTSTPARRLSPGSQLQLMRIKGETWETLRRNPLRRRRRRASSPKTNNRIRPPATPSRGAFFVSLLLSPDRKSRLASQTAYTSADHALGIGLAPPQEAAAPIPMGAEEQGVLRKCPC